MANIFWLSMGYNFGCVIVSGVKLSHEYIAEIGILTDVIMATIFGLLYMECTLAPPGEYE